MNAPELPVIDIAALRERGSSLAARRAVAGRIGRACGGIGFFYAVNHGVPRAVIEDAYRAGRRFFRLPNEDKLRVRVNARHRGFNALGDATMYRATRPDYKEFYSIGLELAEDDPDVLAGEPLRGPNNWPAFVPGFRAALTAYYEALGACGADLLRGVALSLGIAEEFFADKYEKRLQRTQIVYYPPQPPDLGDDQFGVAPHTDFGCITLLWQDERGGLEVRRPDGGWLAAPPLPGSLVVNVADLLARWSNERYRSAEHRVVNRSGAERFSIATFYDPDFKAAVDPRDLGLPEGATPRHERTTAGAYILGRIDASFGYRKRAQAAANARPQGV
jgi:isopenicillin N synthase-like dioxygenase